MEHFRVFVFFGFCCTAEPPNVVAVAKKTINCAGAVCVSRYCLDVVVATLYSQDIGHHGNGKRV